MALTRMEKYASYRDRILHEEQFFNAIDIKSHIVDEYAHKINKLNPNIIKKEFLDEPVNDLIPLSKIDTFDISKLQTLKNYLKLINTEKEDLLNTRINDFLFSYRENYIVNKTSGQISSNYIQSLSLYPKLKNIKTKLGSDQNLLINFHGVSNEKIAKLNEVIQISNSNDLEWMNEYQLEKLNDTNEKSQLKKWYFGLIIALGILMLSALIFIIVGVIENV